MLFERTYVGWILTNKVEMRGYIKYVFCICGGCGKEQWVCFQNIKVGKSGRCSSCASIKHNYCDTRLYNIWKMMKQRCLNPKAESYKWYGGKGIIICDDWIKNFQNFRMWALYNGYADNLTIERIQVNGNYLPKNCKWATAKEQARNRTDNVRLNGKILADHAIDLGVTNSCLQGRIRTYGINSKKILSPKRKEFSKYPGVSFDDSNNRKTPWRVRYGKNGKVFPGGRFKTEKEAAIAYTQLKKLMDVA